MVNLNITAPGFSTVAFDANFLTEQPEPAAPGGILVLFNDLSFLTFDGGTGTIAATTDTESSGVPGFIRETGPQPFSLDLSNPESFSFSFGVIDILDTSNASRLDITDLNLF